MALVLLFATDLLDAGCDPLPIVGPAPMLRASSESPDDACAGMCVPDCFCCSHLLPGLPAAPSLAPTWTREASPPLVVRTHSATVPPPDHPPCSLS